MKYFDIIPKPVEDELIKCGVSVSDLLYCIKADLDGEGCYIDIYITFSENTLHIIKGYEKYEKIKRKKRNIPASSFDKEEYSYIQFANIKRIYVDRGQYSARLMIEPEDGTGDYSIARFSLGFAEKTEKFCERLMRTQKHEEIDDSMLEDLKTHCPKCMERYPDPNRPVCPNCVDRRSIIKRLIGMFKSFKLELTMILICIALSGAFSVISPYFGTKMFYDEVLNADGRYYGKIGGIILIMAGISFAGTILKIASGIIISFIAPKVTHTLRTNIFASMQRLSLQFFTSKQTGSLMTRVDRDSSNVFFFFTDILPYGLTNIARLIGISAVMFYLSPILSAGILFIIVVVHIIQQSFFKEQNKLYRKLDVAMRSGNSVLSDAMNGQRVVKAFAREKKEIERYNKRNEDIFDIDYKINMRLSDTLPAIWLVCRSVSALLYCLGAYMVIKGNLEFGALTALLAFTNMSYEPIHFFSWIGDRWARCADAAGRMFEILDANPTVKESATPISVPEMKGNIGFNKVCFSYEAGRPVLKDVTFDVKGGQMFGIVGKTGAGKSTLINLLARLYDVTDGEITIDGIPIKQIPFADLRNNIGIVSQETYLFIGTIADNIRYARPEASMEEVIEAAKSANAHEFITKLPDGYNTKVGQGGIDLSGGEKQRVSIARAIIQKPNILILDEATASMDTRTERKIQAAIDALKQGRTIISIAHRLSTLRDADMLCVIENGELKELGTHDELIRKKGKYFDLYKLQAEALRFIQD